MRKAWSEGLLPIFISFLISIVGSEAALFAKDQEPIEGVSDFVQTEDGWESLEGASILASELVADQSTLVSKPPVQNDILVRDTGGFFTDLFYAFHKQPFRRHLAGMLNRLSYPGDPKEYRLQLFSAPLPWAGIEKMDVVASAKPANSFSPPAVDSRDPTITVFLGILAFADSEDELAALLAHRMSHANPHIFEASDEDDANKKIDAIVSKIQGQQPLDGKHREEIRADLASVERLIKAGYNPAAVYTIHRKISEWVTQSMSNGPTREVFGTLLGKKIVDLREQPIEELRMTAIKLYIMNRGYEQELSDVLESKSPYPLHISLLRLRAQLLSFPFLNKKARMALILALPALGVMKLLQVSDPKSAFWFSLSDFAQTHLEPLWPYLQTGGKYAAIAAGTGLAAYTSYKVAKRAPDAFRTAGRRLGEIGSDLASAGSRAARLSVRAAKATPQALEKFASTLWTFSLFLKESVSKDGGRWMRASLELGKEGLYRVGDFVHSSRESWRRVLKAILQTIHESDEMNLAKDQPLEILLPKVKKLLAISLYGLRREAWKSFTERRLLTGFKRRNVFKGLNAIESLFESRSPEERQMLFGVFAEEFNRNHIVFHSDPPLRATLLELWKSAGGRRTDEGFLSSLNVWGYSADLTPAFEEIEELRVDDIYGRGTSFRYRLKEAFSPEMRVNFDKLRSLMAGLDGMDHFDELPAWQKFIVLRRLAQNEATLSAGRKLFKASSSELYAYAFSRDRPEKALSSILHRDEIEKLEARRTALQAVRDDPYDSYQSPEKREEAQQIENLLLGLRSSGASLSDVLNLENAYFHHASTKGKTSTFADELKEYGSSNVFDRAFVRAASGVTDPYAIMGLLAFSRQTKIIRETTPTGPIWRNIRERWNGRAAKFVRRFFEDRVHTITELRTYIDRELVPRGITPDGIISDCYALVFQHPEWIQSRADVEALTRSEYFWPKRGSSDLKQSRMEQALLAAMDQEKSKSKYTEYWAVEPSAAEALHIRIVELNREKKFYGDSFEEQFSFWLALSSRGVTSTTDALFEKLYSKANAEQRLSLEAEALQGRIWDQPLKVAIARSQVEGSEQLQSLKKPSVYAEGKQMDVPERAEKLKSLVGFVQKSLPERGLGYMSLLEEISNQISSSPTESRLIQEAKLGAQSAGTQAQDFGSRMMSEILAEVLDWPKRRQWQFILFLRGDRDPDVFIREKFPVVGPERVRRVFQLLPIGARAAIIDSFLSSSRGLLPQCDPKSKQAQKVMEFLLANGSPEAKEVGRQILEAFLYSLQGGNEMARTYVLSYLLSMLKSNEEASVGQVLRNVLEVFGTTGVKIGQILAATELLPPEENIYLFDLQERADVPEREDIYDQLRKIIGRAELPFIIQDLRGSGSLKFAVKAKDPVSNREFVLKVLRLKALAHTKAEFRQLGRMAEYLVKNYGSRYGLLRAIISAAQEAVNREREVENEPRRSERAAETVYRKSPLDYMKVQVPKELLVAPRLLASQFAEGESFRKLPEEAKPLAARGILSIETPNLFQGLDSDPEAAYEKIKAETAARFDRDAPPPPADSTTIIVFDPDRHAGNYRIEYLPDGEFKIILNPIDFGQLLEMPLAERDQVLDLFAIGQILIQTGPTNWAAEKIGRMIGHSDPEAVSRIYEQMNRYFGREKSKLREVAAYYTVLAMLNDAGYSRSIAYFDFVRCIMQLGQYRKHLEQEETRSLDPQVQLRGHVKARAEGLAAVMEREIHLTDGMKGRLIERAMEGRKQEGSPGAGNSCAEAVRLLGVR